MIWVFLADGFEETEALATADVLLRAGNQVQLLHAGRGNIVKGSHGIRVICDGDTELLPKKDGVRCVVLPGGMPGTLNLEKNPVVQEMLDWAFEQQILVGAICAAPSILGHRGDLQGKQATCFPGYEQELVGAEVLGRSVVRDGNIVTAKGMGVSVEFGLALCEILNGKKEADKISASLQKEGNR